ncbi:Nitrate transporter [Cytospora mali]|uniref:Nitrate/nitrite transporter n=1 Tax=Cytospora mali TaxID=578113 RepID=A0A194VR62_CYTMA|nr:Nitrate transporter [Valsa mali]
MGLGFTFSDLVKAPEINPINRKARKIPALNVVDVYGRVFFFTWFGFMISFWAWYTFPPLLTLTIKANLHLTSEQVANSNIVSLCATLIIRFIAGPLCDQFGPRKVLAGCMLLGAIPVGLAPLVQTANGLYASRFFIGILGGSFVPCQVWSTGFFDKNVVGTANALTGGWGNAGGGITYFIMPAVYDSFIANGHSMGQAWRLTFIVPLIMLIFTGVAMLLLCPDTPLGKWSDRELHMQEALRSQDFNGLTVVPAPDSMNEKSRSTTGTTLNLQHSKDNEQMKEASLENNGNPNPYAGREATVSKDEIIQTVQGEVVVKPTFKEALKVGFSPQTWVVMMCYFCSFGGELAINLTLPAYYHANFPGLGQTKSANWAAMFGFLNFVTRPLGGVISDVLYNKFGHSLWLKKAWMHTCGILAGILLIIIGQVNSHQLPTFTGLIALMAIFLEAGNGANFSLVPHVHPYANGVVAGFTGGIGNLGGVIFAVIFRFMGGGTDYAKAFWAIGCIHVGLNVLLAWIRPIPKGQVGGH